MIINIGIAICVLLALILIGVIFIFLRLFVILEAIGNTADAMKNGIEDFFSQSEKVIELLSEINNK